MKKIIGLTLFFVVFAVGLIGASELILPKSVQIYMAGISGCKINESELAKNDPGFDGVKFWEPPLASYYRFREWYLDRDSIITDDVAGTISPYHALLAAYDQYGETCDKNIALLFQRYIDQGISVDQYSSLGYTPLHEAIIMKNVELVKILINANADINLRARGDSHSVKGMTAPEMARYFESMNNDTDVQQILNLLNQKS